MQPWPQLSWELFFLRFVNIVIYPFQTHTNLVWELLEKTSDYITFVMAWYLFLLILSVHLPYSSIGGQPRILMAMARDGLLPPFFSTIHPKTFVPVNGTVLTGCSATLMALILDVDQLSGLVSVLCLCNSFYILTQDWSESRLIQS